MPTASDAIPTTLHIQVAAGVGSSVRRTTTAATAPIAHSAHRPVPAFLVALGGEPLSSSLFIYPTSVSAAVSVGALGLSRQ